LSTYLHSNYIWERQIFGQAIFLDSVVQRIALKEMEILEGQQYCWENEV
jgi:hypothetical protein